MNRNAAGVCVRLVDVHVWRCWWGEVGGVVVVLVAGEDQRRVGGGVSGWMDSSVAESSLGRRRALGLTLPTAWSR